MLVPIEKIRPSAFLVRKIEVDEDLRRLAESIKEHGNLVPIKVRPTDGEYEVVFGHRRLEAMKLAGLKECDLIVEAIDDSRAMLEALIENEERLDLSEPQRGQAFLAYKEETGLTDAEIAKHLQRSRWYVSRAIASHTQLAPVIRERIVPPRDDTRSGFAGLTGSHSKVLVRLSDEHHQKLVADKIEAEQLSADQAGQLVTAFKTARDERGRRAILQTRWAKPMEQIEEEAQIEVVVEELEIKEREERKRAWWEEHPSTKEAWKYLKMYRSLLDDVLESVEREKIPPEHCNFLAEFLEKEMTPYLQGVVARLREKAKRWR